jgi:pantoate--beta-alanine ligase
MGFLHDGHLSLVRTAKGECESVAVSIFVNPTQFGPQEDLAAYPRDLQGDLDALRNEEVDLVWIPREGQIYPEGFQTWVTVEGLSQGLEGAHRPGHFRGVTTVVAKLLNAIQPQVAYFGQKDAQQALLIRRMVADLNFPIEIGICPIVREPDGLAMSSRNSYLNPQERQAATVLYRALRNARDAFEEGTTDVESLRAKMLETLRAEPLAEVQYVSVADPTTLEELTGSTNTALLLMAVYVGKTRLIDNILLGDSKLST